MNNKKNKKKFDAVKMMRDIRDKISKETIEMNYEEFIKYMSERLNKNELVRDKKENKK